MTGFDIREKEGKILLIYSEEYDYYILPKDGEAESCEGKPGYSLVWELPLLAARHNRHSSKLNSLTDEIMKQMKLIDEVDLEMRRREREARERKAIAELGDQDYAGMLDFVKQQIDQLHTEGNAAKAEMSYSRYEHTKRVLAWAKRLYDMAPNQSELDYENIMIAVIFHDVGRAAAMGTDITHAHAGAPITRKYLLEHGFPEERVEYICSLVYRHSDKHLMKEPEKMDQNLLMLMEADLLDESGALGIVMDCMIAENRNSQAKFFECFDQICRYTLRIQQKNPMATENGRRIWEEKRSMVEDFVAALQRDIEF